MNCDVEIAEGRLTGREYQLAVNEKVWTCPWMGYPSDARGLPRPRGGGLISVFCEYCQAGSFLYFPRGTPYQAKDPLKAPFSPQALKGL